MNRICSDSIRSSGTPPPPRQIVQEQIRLQATKVGWPMANNPAIKIVRLADPSSKGNNPAANTVRQSAAKRTADADRPLSLAMADVDLAHELPVSTKSIRRMHLGGKLPQPVVVGSRSLRWLRTTIVEWLAAGCPDRDTFESNRKGGA